MNVTNKSSLNIQEDRSLRLNRFRTACARCYHAVLRRLAAVEGPGGG